MTISFRGGRLPAQPARPRLELRHYLTPQAMLLTEEMPAPPPAMDWLSKVSEWPMYGNDQVGDCTCASAGHMIEVSTTYGQGTTVEITDHDVLSAYSAVSGYNPADPSTDRGAVIQDVLTYWQKTGIGGHTILAFAAVDVSNMIHVKQAIDLFGTVNIGFNFPDSAMAQFNAGHPWDVVRGSRIDGGHCVPVGRYNADGTLDCVTWGAVQKMTQAFWRKYVDEAWVVITADWLDARGLDPQGLSLHNLGEDFAVLTGKPNPFPQPQPAPAPAVDPDVLAAYRALQPWAARNGLF